MRFEHRLHRRADRHGLFGIAQEIADHADVSVIGEFDQHGDIGTMAGQRRMHRVMRPLIRIDPALARDVRPGEVEGMAAVADPFGSPLPRAAAAAFLDPQLALPRAVPVRLCQSVRSGGGDGQGWEILKLEIGDNLSLSESKSLEWRSYESNFRRALRRN